MLMGNEKEGHGKRRLNEKTIERGKQEGRSSFRSMRDAEEGRELGKV